MPGAGCQVLGAEFRVRGSGIRVFHFWSGRSGSKCRWSGGERIQMVGFGRFPGRGRTEWCRASARAAASRPCTCAFRGMGRVIVVFDCYWGVKLSVQRSGSIIGVQGCGFRRRGLLLGFGAEGSELGTPRFQGTGFWVSGFRVSGFWTLGHWDLGCGVCVLGGMCYRCGVEWELGVYAWACESFNWTLHYCYLLLLLGFRVSVSEVAWGWGFTLERARASAELSRRSFRGTGFRLSGFQVSGFRNLGFRNLGLGVYAWACESFSWTFQTETSSSGTCTGLKVYGTGFRG